MGEHKTVIREPSKVRLDKIDPSFTGDWNKKEGEARSIELGQELDELEDLLSYSAQHALLVVLQGMDTSGKDGTIRHLLRFSNAQSLRIAAFKRPTAEELAHDFLWRVHGQAPAHGEMTIFNRSHYEDVVAVRVRELVPESVWRGRYDAINGFEQTLSDHKTIVLKFFLHISKDEQKQRLLEREKDPVKSWKLSVEDWKERERWDAYQEAYGDAIGKCSAPHAPWHIIPADKKWYRNLVIMERIVEALRPHRETWTDSLASLGAAQREELEAFRRKHGV